MFLPYQSAFDYFLISESDRKGIIWSVIVSLILFNGIHANQMPKVSTIPIEESFSLAQPGREDGAIIKILNVDSENRRIYELPINPDGWSMLFLKEDLDKVKQYL